MSKHKPKLISSQPPNILYFAVLSIIIVSIVLLWQGKLNSTINALINVNFSSYLTITIYALFTLISLKLIYWFCFKLTPWIYYEILTDRWFFRPNNLAPPKKFTIIRSLIKLICAIRASKLGRIMTCVFNKSESIGNIDKMLLSMDEYPFLQSPTLKKGAEEIGLQKLSDWCYYPNKISLTDSLCTDEMQRPIIYFPGIPAKEFYDAQEFTWASEFTSHFSVMKEELLSVLQGKGFIKYIVPEDVNLEVQVDCWKTYFFIDPMSNVIEENIKKCPNTWAFLNKIPGFVPSNLTMFSALDAQGNITPHTGLCNLFLRVHLPLLVPEPSKSMLRVGDKVQSWEEEKLLIFNDAYDHEVFNFGKKTRIVLFFDIWHPALTEKDLEIIIPAWGSYRKNYTYTKDLYLNKLRTEIDKFSKDKWNAIS